MSDYIFLLSSLPTPIWGEPAPISLEKFEETCRDHLTAEEFDALSRTRLDPPFDDIPHGLPAKFAAWDTCLRNALVPTLAEGRDVSAMLRPETDCFSEIPAIAAAVVGAATVLEAEKWLDTARWEAVGFFTGCDVFTFDAVCAYKLKLLLILKSDPRTPQRGSANLDRILAAVEQKNLQK